MSDEFYEALAAVWMQSLKEKSFDVGVAHVIWSIGQVLNRHRPDLTDDLLEQHLGGVG